MLVHQRVVIVPSYNWENATTPGRQPEAVDATLGGLHATLAAGREGSTKLLGSLKGGEVAMGLSWIPQEYPTETMVSIYIYNIMCIYIYI